LQLPVHENIVALTMLLVQSIKVF